MIAVVGQIALGCFLVVSISLAAAVLVYIWTGETLAELKALYRTAWRKLCRSPSVYCKDCAHCPEIDRGFEKCALPVLKRDPVKGITKETIYCVVRNMHYDCQLFEARRK